ncbi:MAG: hypothetical protein CMJ90_15845 [Planctomycetes bacterium]|nr:hypothetical protein [Planctomycetota bacterium]
MNYDASMTYAPNYETQTFHDVLVEQLRNTPWLMLSVGIHVVIAIVLNFMGAAAGQPVMETVFKVVAEQAPAPLDPIPEVEDPKDIEDPKDPTDEQPVPTEVFAEDPMIDAESEFDEPVDGDTLNDQPIDNHTVNNSTVGLGSSSGSFGDGRGGGRTAGPGGTRGKSFQKPLTAGLDWLARHQSPDGRWDCDAYMGQGAPERGPLCTGKGNAMYDVGVTGLSLLAYLGAGNTHRQGEYQKTVKAGLKWLKAQQDAEGCFGSRGDPHFTYNHAVAALAMAEAYGMTHAPAWRTSAQRGIDFCMKAQNPYKAWRYGVRSGDNDSSVTGWMVMALKSAKLSGLEVNETAMQWARDWIVAMTDEETGRVGYTKRGERPVRAEGRIERFPADTSESLTAVGVLTRIFAGDDPGESAAIKAGAELMAKRLPVWDPEGGRVDMYYWYYASLALFQCGGAEWSAWTGKMKSAMIDTQRDDGNFAGSWDPVGPWGEDGGRVYSTALMTMCMEVFFRYPRVFGTRNK